MKPGKSENTKHVKCRNKNPKSKKKKVYSSIPRHIYKNCRKWKIKKKFWKARERKSVTTEELKQ